MNNVYNYLKENQPVPKSKAINDTLLTVLMTLEGAVLKNKDYFLEEQLREFTSIYAQSNGWVRYIKKQFLKEIGISLGDLKRELKLLEAEGLICYHRFAQQTFIELIDVQQTEKNLED